RARDAAARRGDEAGEAVRRAAQAAARQRLEAATVEPRGFAFDMRRRRRQHVGGIVDEDEDFEAVDGEEGHGAQAFFRFFAAGSLATLRSAALMRLCQPLPE